MSEAADPGDVPENDTHLGEIVQLRNDQQVGDWRLVETVIPDDVDPLTQPREREYELTECGDSWRVQWKHPETETFVIVSKKDARGDGLYDYHARVTIHGTNITVGEYTHETDHVRAIQWAVDWMWQNHDVSHLYDD